MDEDITDAQWHQRQMEEQEMLYNDPAFHQWLDSFNKEKHSVIYSD